MDKNALYLHSEHVFPAFLVQILIFTRPVNNLVQNMLARDSLHFRTELQKTQCDVELKQEIEIGGDVVEVDIPMTINFFWPQAGK